MLQHLSIRNYALIAELEIELSRGLTVITGETGSGKSIILGALQLLCGGRYDARTGRNSEEKTIVEAIFSDIDHPIHQFEDDSEPATTGSYEVILRREITTSGRTRAFINDSPVSLNKLSEVTTSLLDIHTQNSNTEILSPIFQLRLLDSFAGIASLRDKYSECFARYVRKRREVVRLREEAESLRREEEMLRFRYDELKSLAPLRGEITSLEARYELLSNAGRIVAALKESVCLLDSSDPSILSSLNRVSEVLDNTGDSFKSIPQNSDILSRLKSAYLELTDISQTLSSELDNYEENPIELERTENRINRLYEATKRFGLNSPDDLSALFDDTKRRLHNLNSGTSDLKKLETEAKAEGKKLQTLADELSEARMQASSFLAAAIEKKARPLGLDNLHVAIRVEKTKLTPEGQDKVVICCGFNKNQTPMPLAQRASGGEMSRLMLAIKAMEVSVADNKTIIFDEIDTGVSGSTASLMGQMMREIATGHQVLAITHLPQVAAMGSRHFKVYKQDNTQHTHTYIADLCEEERVVELAKMLSGAIISDASMQNARELLRLKN